ncbi:MAG: hypothetical protein HZA08_01030 [Nitrospirae bacterium]|nr:hypothetical protein [Nitrospirota bacterium]
MDQTMLKAFAGHSFDERDRPLVDKILKFLRSAGVECKSGEPAENRSVSTKVKERIDHNSIFVGIFTRRCKLDGQELYATSNWVIQESGYAIGKGKELILLVENGIDNLPELQGDLEYVPFQRDSLEDTFRRLIEMIGAVRTRLSKMVSFEAASEPPIAEQPLSFSEEQQPEITRPAEASETPQTVEERKNEAINRMIIALIHEKNLEKGQRIFREDATPLLDDKERILWEGVCLRNSYMLGDVNALRHLEELVAANPKNEDAHRQLAIALESMKMWDKATREFLTSADLESDSSDKCSDYRRAALCMFMGGRITEGKKLMEEKLQQYKNEEPAYHLYKALIDMADKEGDKETFVLHAERALELNPADHNLRFQTAYKYNELSRRHLGLYHYRLLETHNRDGACLNNLGVVLSGLQLPCRSIASYKESAELKNTLAMANLAYKYLETGFANEALGIINGAFKLAGEVDVHGNVGQAKIAIEEAKENENKKEQTILQEAEAERAFRLPFAEGLCTRPDSPLDLNGKWHWGDWDGIIIRQSGAQIEGSFEQTIPLVGLLGLFANSSQIGKPELTPSMPSKKQKVMIHGEIKNLTATIDITITEEYERAFPYPETPSKAKAMVVFNADGQQGNVYQESPEGKSKYYMVQKMNNPTQEN